MEREVEQQVLLRYLGKLYRKYSEIQGDITSGVEEGEGHYVYNDIAIDIEQILRKLPIVYAQIIYSDFLVVKNELWWQNKYDEKSYLELKNMAVKAFFHCLYV